LIDERYPVYALADLTVQSQDVPHDRIVDGVLRALAEHLGAGGDDPLLAGERPP
jgi:hypothetical protein